MKKKHKKIKNRKRLHKKRVISKEINTNPANKTKKENKIIVGAVIIILFLIAIKIIGRYESQDTNLKKDAERLLNAITTNNLENPNLTQLNEESLEEIMQKDYIKLKEELGLKNDFCIRLEDSNGELIKINGIERGIGSSKVKVNGVSCG